MLHERRVSNYGIQMKYQNILFLIYIISYWHHSRAQGHTFCLREKGISACGCQHSPWGRAWDLPNLQPLCQPSLVSVAGLDPGTGTLWPISHHVDASAVHPLQLLSLDELRYSGIRSSHLLSLPLPRREKSYLLEMDWRDSLSLSCFIEYITSLDLLSGKWNELTVSGWPSGQWITTF